MDNGGKMTILDKAISCLTECGKCITPTYSVKYGKGYNLNTGTKAGCLVFMKDAHLVFIRDGQAYVIENDEDGFPPSPCSEIIRQVQLAKGDDEEIAEQWVYLFHKSRRG